MALTGYEKIKRHRKKKREEANKVLEKATILSNKKISAIVKRDKILYNSLFAYPVLVRFAKEKELSREAFILLMVTDLYLTITKREAIIWGLGSAGGWLKWTNELRDRSYLVLKQGFRSSTYYATIKGKNLIKEFNQYYDEHAKKILGTFGKVTKEDIRKVTRVKATRFDQPNDRLTGGKPENVKRRGGASSTGVPGSLEADNGNCGNNA